MNTKFNMSHIADFENLTAANEWTPVNATAVFGPPRDSLFIVIPITIIYSIIFITGLLGNIFTCLVIVRNRSMHTATNYYLFSLAISDLLLLISGMPQEIYYIWSKWPYIFGPSFCVIRGLAAETSTNASVLTITLFTAERYLAICHPFVSHKMSKLSRALKHVIFLWLISLCLALPQALQFGIKRHKGVTLCLQTRVIIEHSFEISTFFVFFAPMVLITVLYSLIGLKLRETNKSKEQSQKEFEKSVRNSHKIRRKHSQSTRRVVKMLVAVVVAFFVCWAPFHAQRLVAIYGTTEGNLAKTPILLSVYYFLTYISGVFYYVSTCINPILYQIMSNKFREAFKTTIAQWCCKSNDRASGKRCSYTAIAFPRNATISGNSLKNTLRHDSNNRFKMRRQDSREKTQPTIQTCHKEETVNTTPLRKYENVIESQQVLKESLKDSGNILDTSLFISNDSPISYPPPKETVTISIDAIVSVNKNNYISDELGKYLNETKLSIIQREKEYG